MAPPLTQDKELAYRRGAEAWYRYRKTTTFNPFSLAHLGEIVADLPGFLSSRFLRDTDLVPVDRIAAVAVWDTVGALGIPEFDAQDRRVDAFRFCDTTLSPKVSRGFHAVALDEQREDFTPTLWDSAPNVTQVLFPGAHGDVGGGYALSNGECGLSDGTLQWMITHLTDVGVLFSNTPAYRCTPNPTGTAHKPWLHLPWNLPDVKLGTRSFPSGMPEDPSIAARMAAVGVVAEPGEAATPYHPTNRP